MNHLFASRPIFSKPRNAHSDLGRAGTQTETNYAATVGEHGNRENPSGQKSSHLFFVRRSLCQETQNKEGATVITPFLPTGFSRASARETGRPGPSQHDPATPLHIKYSQKEGPGHISQVLLTKQPIWEATFAQRFSPTCLKLGPRAKTLRQEVHFSYPMQLSDRQELLRSSRNLSQKMTPWHEEHSDGLCSQGHIWRTQAHLCARPVPLKSRQRKLSDGTKNVEIRHRELGQKRARTGTRFEKKRAGSKTHFFFRTAAFARRVFPARNKLIREPGCVGKIMTPATTWNSRFADSIPRLTGIFIGKVHKNSSDTPTSGSHNSLVRSSDSRKLYTVGKRTSRAFRRYAA
uniref:Uncharacterized protein n=1 Tax=Fagus sylvatica TaxID=28930 RepID=A0A2N9GU38_FAGSY